MARLNKWHKVGERSERALGMASIARQDYALQGYLRDGTSVASSASRFVVRTKRCGGGGL